MFPNAIPKALGNKISRTVAWQSQCCWRSYEKCEGEVRAHCCAGQASAFAGRVASVSLPSVFMFFCNKLMPTSDVLEFVVLDHPCYFSLKIGQTEGVTYMLFSVIWPFKLSPFFQLVCPST